LFDELSASGFIVTGPLPGLPFFPNQTVIFPPAFGAVNGQMVWTITPLEF
jgi:hypothetical protein